MPGFNGSFLGQVLSIPFSGSYAVTFFASSLNAVFGLNDVKIVPGKRMPKLTMGFSPTKFGRPLNCREKIGKFFCRKNLLNGESSGYSANDSTARYAQFSNPSGDSFSNSVVGNKPVVSPIIGLCFQVSPTAVFRGIPLGIINSVNTHAGWWVAHVPKKVFKTLPSIADFYAFCSVVFKGLMRRIVTPSFHMIPDGISLRRRESVGSFHLFNPSKIGGKFAILR